VASVTDGRLWADSPEEDNPMTLLGAVFDHTTGDILVAADRRATRSTDPTSTRHLADVDKWHPLAGSLTLMWAWSGSQMVGEPLGAWLDSTADHSSWAVLQAGVCEELKRLNLALGKLPGSLTECLIAGYIGNQPGILYAPVYGAPKWRPGETEIVPCFIGYQPTAGQVDFTWHYVNRLPLGKRTLTKQFYNIMRLAIEENMVLGGFAAWQITPHANKRTVCEPESN
jgi:hypothetical protein